MECLEDCKGSGMCPEEMPLAVVYFYPKDNTPGCTTEAVEFSQLKQEFEKLGAVVIGISPDSCESHEKFMAKHSLSISLISDKEKKLAKKFKVWKKKRRFGKEYYGIERSTFILSRGKAVKEWRNVRAKGHAKEVLEWLKENIKSLGKK